MFGLIEEISTIYSIDYNNESAQLSTFFVHKKNRDHFPGVTNFNWGHYFWGLIWGQF